MIAARWSAKWQPIWILVIDHPEGIFIVDTGITVKTRNPWFKMRITRDEEVHRQLTSLHIKPEQITSIILTHHHFDHTGGLRHFPNTPIDKPAVDDITLIPTPGHTKDHKAVLVKTDTFHILFAGDLCETQDGFLRSKNSKDAAIKAYAQTYPLIFLPTHDPGSGQRLATLTPLLPSPGP